MVKTVAEITLIHDFQWMNLEGRLMKTKQVRMRAKVRRTRQGIAAAPAMSTVAQVVRRRVSRKRRSFRFEGIFYNHVVVKGHNRDTA